MDTENGRMDTDAASPVARPEPRWHSEQLMSELGATLVERNLLTRAQADELASRAALLGEPFSRLVADSGLVPETEVLSVLADLSGIPFRRISDFRVEPAAVAHVPARVALRYQVMPLELAGGIIRLAVAEVPKVATVDGLRMILNLAVDWVLCTRQDISRSIKHFYGLGVETIDAMGELKEIEEEPASTDVAAAEADAGIIRFVNQIIHEAIRMEATDIHIEPFENDLRLRYRIDGILQTIPIPPNVKRVRRAVVSCIKIMADMNIAERRKPHDGRIKVRSGDDEFDLRVSILPTRHGETVNLRLLNRKSMFMDLENLGLTREQLPQIEYLSSLPHGVVLLTGPTGSGKTTTLYAVLSRLNHPDVKIITVEDPIEYQMPGINQIQVHAQIGLTFATILRSILRHDPDIVLIGEIRDSETADIAVRASLTGHLVFSTLHTNDAPSSIMRLVDMGVEPFLVSSCLEGVVAQRLVRRICRACAEECAPDDVIVEEIARAWPDRVASGRFLRGRGCPECNFTGYRGRIALLEIMMMNDAIRAMVTHQRPSNEIKSQAIKNGMITLRRDGWARVLEGITTVEEVLRVARKDDLPI